MFRRTITIRFEEADARGVLFYGRLQALAHHVWEDFVVSTLVNRWEDWFESQDFVAPIKHAEATYHRPLRPGHSYLAELTVAKVGESSLEVVTRFLDESGSEPVVCARNAGGEGDGGPGYLEEDPDPVSDPGTAPLPPGARVARAAPCRAAS